MSRRQRRAQRERTDTLPGRIPGGCLDCNAYQTIDRTHEPVFALVVHHDESCPTHRLKATR